MKSSSENKSRDVSSTCLPRKSAFEGQSQPGIELRRWWLPSQSRQFEYDKRWLLLLDADVGGQTKGREVVKPVQVGMFARVGEGRLAASRVTVVNVDDGAEGEAGTGGCACEETTTGMCRPRPENLHFCAPDPSVVGMADSILLGERAWQAASST